MSTLLIMAVLVPSMSAKSLYEATYGHGPYIAQQLTVPLDNAPQTSTQQPATQGPATQGPAQSSSEGYHSDTMDAYTAMFGDILRHQDVIQDPDIRRQKTSDHLGVTALGKGQRDFVSQLFKL